MLKLEDNQRVTQPGPGPPLGDVFRRYWMPAVLSRELPEPDCPPVRVKLLGEELVAFRDSEGQVGLIDAYCPHRRAPLFFGRNEECGLRCVYHGWKFDVNGTCVDMPNETAESNFKQKVKIKRYPCWEAGDVVWTYMGPPEHIPPHPDYEWLRVPSTHRHISKTFEHCNYLQALEGGIDTSHSSFTHNNDITEKKSFRKRDTAPKLEVEKTPYGFRYAGLRKIGNGELYVRAYQFIMPFQQFRGNLIAPEGVFESDKNIPKIDGHMWVPVDDETCYVYNWMYSTDVAKPMSEEFCLEMESLMGRGPDDFLPGYPPYRLKKNGSNDYLIDRELQKKKTFTGIVGVNTQDFALQEGMGPITDRTKEHLGASDLAIITARQLLLEASRAVGEGKEPKGVDPESYRGIRAGDAVISAELRWQDGMKDLLVATW